MRSPSSALQPSLCHAHWNADAVLFCGAQVVSALHQRFPDLFTPPFSTLLVQGLKPATSTASDRDIQEKENNARIVKQRGVLRVVGELEAVGIIRRGDGKGTPGEVTWAALKDLVRGSHQAATLTLSAHICRHPQLTSDKEALALVAPLAIAFAKHLGPIYLPRLDASSAVAGEGAEPSAHDFPAVGAEVDDGLIPREMKDKFRKLLVAYFDALGKREQRLHVVRCRCPAPSCRVVR